MRWTKGDTVFLLLLALAVAIWSVLTPDEGAAQYSGGGIASIPVESGAPANPADGQQWVRSTDLQRFVYSSTLGKWLGELEVWNAGHVNANHTGFLQVNPRSVSDTTTGAEVGYSSDGVMRVMKAVGNAGNAPNCSVYVFSDQDTIAKLVWGGTDQMVWTPTADSSGGWIAPAARVVFDDTDVYSASYVPSAAPTNPTLSTFWIYVREEVTP